MSVPHNANTHKHLGCLGSTTTGNATHGAPLVHQVLRGFSYDQERYDHELKQDRQRDLCTRFAQLTEDSTALIEALTTYTEMCGAMPQTVVDRVYDIGKALTDAARMMDPGYLTWVEEQEAARLWDFHTHYGKEARDY